MLRLIFVIFVVKCPQILASNGTETCHPEPGRCYWLGTGSVSWGDARTACQSEGGDLAVMETEELWNFVNVSVSFSTDLWIGLSDIEQESDWRWVNRDVLSYEQLGPVEPNGQRSQNCMHVDSTTKVWIDSACTDSKSFLCSSKAPNCSEAKSGCTNFPFAFMGKITGPYGSANFQTAKTVCEDLGQKLLTIDSQEEEDYIKDNLDLVSNIWLGITDSDVPTVWRTPDGFVSPWFNWNSPEPNGLSYGLSQHCAVTDPTHEKWVDVPCSDMAIYYCEAQRMYLNNVELDNNTLTDNDLDTCITLGGSQGCVTDKIMVRSPIVNSKKNVTVTAQVGKCEDFVVAWKIDWDQSDGKSKVCTPDVMETTATSKYVCSFICDVTEAVTMEIGIKIKMTSSTQPSIYDVKVR